jgi:hypothetical protein
VLKICLLCTEIYEYKLINNVNLHFYSLIVLYSILIEFGVHMKLVRLIKICLKETSSKSRIGKYLSDNFPIQNGLK